MTAAVQQEVLPYDKNLLRRADRFRPALDHEIWADARGGPRSADAQARSAAAMAAHARWMYNAALARTETRGMHKREDHPDQDPAQHHRLLTGGLDEVWTAPLTAPGVRAVAS